MYMKRKMILFGALLLLAGCRSGDGPETAVDAAMTLSVSDVRTSSVSVTAVSKQEHVVSYRMTPPIPTDQINWRTLDAVDKTLLLEERGMEVATFPHVFPGLKKLSSYFIVAVGCDADGKAVTAPTVTEFETTDIVVSVETGWELLADGTYRYKVSVLPDASVDRYFYLFDMDHAMSTPEELRSLLTSGSDAVKTGTGARQFTVDDAHKGTAVLGLLAYDESGQEGDLVTAYASAVSVVTIDYGSSVRLSQPDLDKDVFEGTFDAPSRADFTLNIDGTRWGFIAYSGNGGIGAVRNEFAAVPYYYIKETVGVTVGYEVGRSIGRMTRIEDGGKSFWLNMSAPAKVYVHFDFETEDGIPRYYMEEVKDDPSVVLEQDFDLFCYSGDYMAPVNGARVTIDPDQIDGTEPGTPVGISTAQSGVIGGNKNITAFNSKVFNYPAVEGLGASAVTASESYIRNRGMEGWTLRCCGEKPNAIQLSIGNGYLGVLTTPVLDQLTGPTDIVLEIDMARFSAASKNLIALKILGAGTFSSGEVLVDGLSTRQVEVSGDQFDINADVDVCPPSVNNDAKNKPVSHFRFRVNGATAETRISLDTSVHTAPASSSATRAFVFRIKVTK